VAADGTAHHFVLPAVTDWRKPAQSVLPRDFAFPAFKTLTHVVRLWDCTGALSSSKHLVRTLSRVMVGVVALSAVQSEADQAFQPLNGFTRQHLMLAYARGVRRLVGTLKSQATSTPSHAMPCVSARSTLVFACVCFVQWRSPKWIKSSTMRSSISLASTQ
jgi:hypothetical protein